MDDSLDHLTTFDPEFGPSSQLEAGQFIGEHQNYCLEKSLGMGGMGEVWLATEIRGGKEIRSVVCKTLKAGRRELSDAQEKALKQFQLIQKLNHTNICPIYIIEEDPVCGYLIVMGYAGGGTFADWFENQPDQNGGIPLATVCDVLRPIADALDFMHSQGVIHRDVKPRNMMFTSEGVPWLIDFGIAASLRSESLATKGQFSSSGTDRYMAPEQKRGELQTAQTDQYSLAMVALEFLAGSLSPLAFAHLPAGIQAILEKALSENPAGRYATCREFIDALSVRKTEVEPVAEAPAPPRSALDHLIESERQTEDARSRATEENLRQQVAALEERIQKEYQSARYEDAIVHLKELLRLKPENPNAQWLLQQATKNLEVQKKVEAERMARQEAKRQEFERMAREDAQRKKFPFQAGMRTSFALGRLNYIFRWCPPGEFMMGSPLNEPGRDDDEKRHKVKLTRGFWMLETQVTQAMWKSVMGTNPSIFRDGRKSGSGFLTLAHSFLGESKGRSFPVEGVSWDECQEFCRKLSQMSGKQIQLPTEAQWEYACRAGTTGAWAGTIDSMAWYDRNSEEKTHPVAQKAPNAWGLHDMHGNVWEWCSDWYDKKFYDRSPITDPENTTPSGFHVNRGGGWNFDANHCRSANRGGSASNSRFSYLGFRFIWIPDQE